VASTHDTRVLERLVIDVREQIHVDVGGLKGSAYWPRPIDSSHLPISLMA
jgi:hypothetical protein